MKRNRSRIEFILSMVIFGTIGLFVKYIPIPSGELALYRACMAAIMIGSYLLLGGRKLSFGSIKKEVPLLIVSGVAMGVNWVLLFEAYRYTTISLATLSYYFAPVLVTIVSPFLFQEKLTIRQIICFAMSTVGLVCMVGVGEVGQLSASFQGILFGLGAACFYATVMILNKLIKGVEGIQRTFLQFLSAIVILVVYVAATGGIHPAQIVSVKGGLLCLLIVGIVHTGITYCMYFSSLKELPGQQVAILSYIDPLVAVLVSVLILKEPLTLLQAVGGILILGFALWNELPSGSSS